MAQNNVSKLETVVFGTGCFWCTEAIFSRLRGIISVEPGYSGGTKDDPSYTLVCSGTTGHAEVVKITFDPSIISFEVLLAVFWYIHDPTSLNRQGADVGTQYRSVIFYATEEQRKKAERAKKALEDNKTYARSIVTEIKPLINFYPAEDYHQQYYENNPTQGYCRLVIDPKVESFSVKFREWLKQ